MQFNSKNFDKFVQEQSRVLTLLSNGKIYIVSEKNGCRLHLPDYLRKGFELLIEFFVPDSGKKLIDKYPALNEFFKELEQDIYLKKSEEGVELLGRDVKKLHQFLRTIMGFDIDVTDVYF